MAADLDTVAVRADCMVFVVVNLMDSIVVHRVAASDFVGHPVDPVAVHSYFECERMKKRKKKSATFLMVK